MTITEIFVDVSHTEQSSLMLWYRLRSHTDQTEQEPPEPPRLLGFAASCSAEAETSAAKVERDFWHRSRSRSACPSARLTTTLYTRVV